MSTFKKTLLILLLPLFAFTTLHKFYLSVTNVGYSEKDEALQITSRVFIDDFEAALLARYDFKGELATEKEAALADEYIEKYIRAKFVIYIDEKAAEFDFIGKRYEDDLMICYIEVPNVLLSDHKSITIQNEILTDMYDEQQNVVHFKINGKKKSFVLIRENNKGMLNL
ncbi:hypothetical protein FGM00_03040 [Aggregatimonas sangjinii]|uniref:Peptidase E n=1 Tax=Aggregatimonas sangjinii TaxID=2583587 RepID=A0A5B7SNZ3_9FLAO|nr:DUF6702 family protein [Aggregatimonas sangjinii]QCW99138.1 hypothetical protein FGM00_03040 [Aggregatimonas sangjinii]